MQFTSRLLLILPGFLSLAVADLNAAMAKGRVFHDLNGNGVMDAGEPGLPGIGVSNQKEVVETDAKGHWELPHGEDTAFFVIKPQGWRTPVSHDQLPQFSYLHKPKGSPKTKFPGVAPTGPLPESIDFPLYPQKEPDAFEAIFFGDPQPRNQEEIDYIAHDVIEELMGSEAAFGVTLGDILFDDLSLFNSMNRTVAMVGIPWYNVIGNHDINYDAPNDRLSDETYEATYGPNYYSFNYGPTHFIVLDDVDWGGRKPAGSGKYTAGLDADQLAFVKNDLARVPEDRLVVLMMHIPLIDIGNRGELYRLIEKRPYTLSISGHTHWQSHEYIGKEDGWKGAKPHHHIINVTVCGTWWSGAKDETGIPHTMMRDGAPNGYSILRFDGHEATFSFKAARFPKHYQMNVHAPEEIPSEGEANRVLHVNVFAGAPDTVVRFRTSPAEPWVVLEKVLEHDPLYVEIRDREMAQEKPPGRPLNAPVASRHLWKGDIPKGLQPGAHVLFIEARLADGRVFQDRRVIRVR